MKTNWHQVYRKLLPLPWRKEIRIPKYLISHPKHIAGFYESEGSEHGQSEDWRMALEGGSGLHIRVYPTYYTAHLDEVDPSVDLVEHLRQDSPEHYVAVSAVTGGVLGYLADPQGPGWFWGALLGAALGNHSARIARKDDARRRRARGLAPV